MKTRIALAAVICGTVTSKNGFGGYGDPIPFISAGTAEFTFMRGDVDDWPQLSNHLCAN